MAKHAPHLPTTDAAPPLRVWRRATDALVGPAPSTGRVATILATAACGSALAAGAAWTADLPPLAVVVTGAVAFDFFGGAVATSTAAGKRQDRAPSPLSRLGFVAAHVQPFLLALCVPGLDLWTAAALYLIALVGAVAVWYTPSATRRPVAFAATVTGSAGALLLLPVPAALAWVAPVMLVKLLLGHMLHEAAAGVTEERTHGTQESRPGGAA